MTNIYVGNLDFGVTEDQLRQLFSTYGQVDKISLVTDRDTGQPRGFGFVEMSNGGEAAIAGLNGSNLGGRNITVNEARPKKEGGRGGFGGGGDRGGFGGGGGGRGRDRGGNRGGRRY